LDIFSVYRSSLAGAQTYVNTVDAGVYMTTCIKRSFATKLQSMMKTEQGNERAAIYNPEILYIHYLINKYCTL